MEQEPDYEPRAPRAFSTTRWSVVLASRSGSEAGVDALDTLCRTYWFPLYAFVRRNGHDPQDAQDLTQEFFARLLEKRWLDDVARERGRFRSWLLAAMKHFLANEWKRTRTIKRGGHVAFLSLDDDSAESRYRREPVDPGATPEEVYDRQWALTLLDQVLAKLGAEMEASGRRDEFEALKFSLTDGRHAYAEVAATLGISEGGVKVAVHRLRARYREMIRAEIAETLATPGDIEAEMRDLLAALSG
jgi:RNA polymerase sigma-70 factor (ECF subfamily)